MSPKYPNRNTSDVYTGPSVSEMLASHTLAKEIIARHNDECPILDDASIVRLQRFIADPSAARSQLADRGFVDVATGEISAEKVRASGCLVAYVMARHGTDKEALTDEEIATLKEWFDSGAADLE